ncbi:AAA family ATPase [Wolbachia endosymbiont of Drosophila aff. chauvacae BK-2020]|uniref:AAA family ATPase n=1 Tax=unclassified Wolbachia TaxID=2640676 RepID=UPI0023A9AC5A|nr:MULTISPECIES: AAA family ATPase [unclassified Wolbachia]MDE5059919.1 AAA family ATPase [Wolbachia endosymbiont of Drosophila burlai]MDU8909583.1 AAA family ATPase [Wolbachia endosymbiont of Drosophila bocqueti]WOE62349.1 AAA family ATPase [Wolbachia endosymbiont of Drosophila aff. chauvacae BK-2020]
MDIYCSQRNGHYKLLGKKEQLRTQLLSNIRSCLSYLLPRGTFRGDKFYVGDLQGNKGQSMIVELTGSKAGLWHDFSTEEGGDIFDLWAAVTGKNQFTDTIEDIAKWIGYSEKNNTLGQPTASWNYYDESDQVIVTVYRYNTDSGKRYLPFDVKRSSFTLPETRPLYNIPGIVKSDKVILVEGEKCADALIEQGMTATTAMLGANAPIEKTDWSPLKGKHVIIWPDNDEPGKQYAEKVVKKLTFLGVLSLTLLEIPENKPKGWDSADGIEEKMNIPEFIENNSKKIIVKQLLNIQEWSVERFIGPVPEQKFLVEGLFPLGVTSILAAMGDTGKGMLLLDLALKVASRKDQPCGFGPLVTEHGSVVIFSAEDDMSEIHRRLERLDSQCERLKYKDRLFIVPLPNVSGSLTIIKSVSGKVIETSPEFELITKQLNKIKNLKLIVFDPLASFVHADLNTDPAVGDYLMSLLSDLAGSTGASIITAHHMRKPKSEKPISTVEQARDAIRGTSALVNGVRCSYAFWSVEDAAKPTIFKSIGESVRQNALFYGAIVKANGLADRTLRTYLRNEETGLLEDITERLRIKNMNEKDSKQHLITAITRAAISGHPFTHTGSTGVYKQRHRLPEEFHSIGRDRMERIVQELLQTRKLVKGMATGSKEDKWLDIPSGPFARGVGKFSCGAELFS